MTPNYNKTITAGFMAYIVQSVVNNFMPLLFVVFNESFNIPLTQITLLVTINFSLQLIMDISSVFFIDRIGYRAAILIAHISAIAGLIALAVLPNVLPNPYVGILIAVMLYAVGGGLIEVIVSPLIQACPSDNKEAAMSMLHSFYCWGSVGVVLVSTIFFKVFGIDKWPIMAIIWAVLPIINTILFARVPIPNIVPEGESGMTIKQLLSVKVFWVLMIMMVCAGASEQAVSQWASAFAEKGLGLSKAMGDLAGPMLYSIMMGISRTFYGKAGDRIDLDKIMLLGVVVCIASYICIAISPNPAISLIACAISGLSVGLMWPGTFSKAANALPVGGTAMFAFLALGGDIGCTSGPTLAGIVSGMLNNNLKLGIAAAIIFPIVLLICILRINHIDKE